MSKSTLLFSQEGEEENFFELEPFAVSAGGFDQTDRAFESTVIVGQDWIDRANLLSLNDTYRYVANVRPSIFPDGGFVIRGINTESPDVENVSGGQAPLATVYVDGVALGQQGTRRGPLGLWDVRRMEVFRGPQGTRQGRNASAGAVFLETNDPGPEWETAVRLATGSFDYREANALINIPFTEAWAARVTGSYSIVDSIIDYPNYVDQPEFDTFGRAENWSIRGKLAYDGGGPLRARLTLVRGYGSPTLSDAFGPNSPLATGGEAGTGPSFEERLWLQEGGGQQYREAETTLAALLLTWDEGDGWTWTSQTAWARTDLTVAQINGVPNREDIEEEYSQEIRLNYTGDRVNVVAGIYGNRQEGTSSQGDLDKTRENMALFGEAERQFGENWFVTAGIRLDRETAEFMQSEMSEQNEDTVFLPKVGFRYALNTDHAIGFTLQRGYRSGGAGVAGTGENAETFSFAPSFTWNPELNYRGSFLEGRVVVELNAFYVAWQDQQVTLRDFDFETFLASERVINASDSELGGLELEIQARLGQGWQAFLSAATLDSRYNDFRFQVDENIAEILGVPSLLDFEGYEFPESPDFTTTVGLQWRHEDGWFFTADAEYVGHYYSPYLFAPAGSGLLLVSVQVPQDATVEVGDHTTFNLSAGGQWRGLHFTVFVRNVFDENYLLLQAPLIRPDAEGIESIPDFLATVGRPREYGVSVEYRF